MEKMPNNDASQLHDQSTTNCMQALRLAVAIAVIRSKPPDLTAKEYAEQLYTTTFASRSKYTLNKALVPCLSNFSCNPNLSTVNKMESGDMCDNEEILSISVTNRQLILVKAMVSLGSLTQYLATLDPASTSAASKIKLSSQINQLSQDLKLITNAVTVYFESCEMRSPFCSAVFAAISKLVETMQTLELGCYQRCVVELRSALQIAVEECSKLASQMHEHIVAAIDFREHSRSILCVEVLKLLSRSTGTGMIIVQMLVQSIGRIRCRFMTLNDLPADRKLRLYLFNNVGMIFRAAETILLELLELVENEANDVKLNPPKGDIFKTITYCAYTVNYLHNKPDFFHLLNADLERAIAVLNDLPLFELYVVRIQIIVKRLHDKINAEK